MKKVIIALLIFNMIFLTGCWDMRELNELALVMVVGIDKSDDPNGGFTVTVQVAKPNSGGAGKQGGTGGEGSTWTASADGKTIFEAIRNIARGSSRRIMWAHNNVVIIGEAIAREDITPIVDFFTHNRELRMKTWVGVSRGPAKQYINAKIGMEDIPGIALAELFRYQELPGASIQTSMLRLYSDFLSDSIQPLVAVFRLKDNMMDSNKKQVELAGGAVFKGVRMVGWLSPEEIRGLTWIRGENKNAIISVSDVLDKKNGISVELKNINVKMSSELNDGKEPSINIKLTAKGEIAEEDGTSGISIDQLKAKVKQSVETQMKKSIKLGLDKVQREYKSDVLGFGRIIHIQHKEQWDKYIKKNWEDTYPLVAVNLEVNVDIHTSVLYQQPIKLEKQSGGLKNEDKN